MSKYAIVFSSENKSDDREKMAMGLAYSIRKHMPDVDVYCGNFTNNAPSIEARLWFRKHNITLVTDKIFDIDKDDNSVMFLRTFTQDYFARMLLDQYDFLVYVDIDVVFLKPLEFNFDPTSPMILTETCPPAVHHYHATYLTDFAGNLYYNWIQVINKHNRYIFELDWSDLYTVTEHNADKMISKLIDNSDLLRIEQQLGGYYGFKWLTLDSYAHHYDSLKEIGTLYLLEWIRPDAYQEYKDLFERRLNIKIENDETYWDRVIKAYNEERTP